jgi:glycine oxidase
VDGISAVIVVGAGVIGLSVAWRSAQRGLRVTVVDPAPGSGASWTAAGMLAPVTELHYEGRDLLALNLDSAARYPAFVAELAEASGVDVGYRRCGTVQAAWDAADLAALRDLRAFHAALGVDSRLLTGRELRAEEPSLAAGLPGGLWAPGDHQVDNRLLHGALRRAATAAGAELVAARVTGWLRSGNRVTGVRTDDGRSLAADTVVLAAGAWSGAAGAWSGAAGAWSGAAGGPPPGLPADAVPPVRPVKGQTLRLRGPRGLLGHVVRGSVRGSPVYVVPRLDGTLVVGASSEEAGFDLRARAGAVFDLLRDAQALVPALSEAEFVEVSTGLRPGSPDNAPLIGHGPFPGLVYATGHYRNGILLAPLTADLVAGLLAGTGTVPAVCDPQRYAGLEARA